MTASDDAGLERSLRDAGRRISFPPTPRLQYRVMRAIEQPAAHPRQPSRRRASLVLVASILVTSVAFTIPGVRRAAADLLGLGGVSIRTGPPRNGTDLTGELDLGQRTTFRDASAQMSFKILRPSLPWLGSPDEVYVDLEAVPGGQVSLVYGSTADLPAVAPTRVGLLITEFRGRPSPAIIEKELTPGTPLGYLSVNGAPAYWIEGWHSLFYMTPEGEVVRDRARLAGSTLLWEHGGTTIRIETPSKEIALRVAESMS